MNIEIRNYTRNDLLYLTKGKVESYFFKNLYELLEIHECKSMYVEYDISDDLIISEFETLYSKTFRNYPRLTKRIHFFKKLTTQDNYFIGQDLFIVDDNEFKQNYIGFITIRPYSEFYFLGPTFLRLKSSVNWSLISTKKIIHFNGEDRILEGIPFIQEDGQISKCVESAIWISLGFLNYKFSSLSLKEISEALYNRSNVGNPQNQKGATTIQIIDLFQRLGYRAEAAINNNSTKLDVELILFMLNSNMPVLCGIREDEGDSYSAHLIVLIGYSENSKSNLFFSYFDSRKGVMCKINQKELASRYYALITINPRDIYLEYSKCDTLIYEIENILNINSKKLKKDRFITKSKKFKKYVAFSSMNRNLQGLIIGQSFPDNIMVVEYSYHQEEPLKTIGQIIIDTTAIGNGLDLCLFAHFQNTIFSNSSDSETNPEIISLNFESSGLYESFLDFERGKFEMKRMPLIGQINSKIPQEELIQYLKKFKEKTVLILGKDTGKELKILRSIQTTLKELGYTGIIVKDFDDIPQQSNEEKVRLMASASRFVILENSYPAGQIAELSKICSTSRTITATLREDGKGSSFMVTDYDIDYNHIKEFNYSVIKDLKDIVTQAVDWAEIKIEERINHYNKIYPWR